MELHLDFKIIAAKNPAKELIELNKKRFTIRIFPLWKHFRQAIRLAYFFFRQWIKFSLFPDALPGLYLCAEFLDDAVGKADGRDDDFGGLDCPRDRDKDLGRRHNDVGTAGAEVKLFHPFLETEGRKFVVKLF